MPRRFFVRRFTRRIVTMSFVGLIAAVAVWVTIPRETAAVAADSVASLEQATWQAEYFANATLSGTPVATRSETGAPNYDWGAGHPADLALPNDSSRPAGQ